MEFWTLVTSLASIVAMTTAQRVDFGISEGLPALTFVGNVATGAGLSTPGTLDASITSNLRFSILTQGDNPFSLDELSGIIRTSEIIDRDAICPQEVTCEIHIEIAALSSPDFYRTINVYITINDENDEAPTWEESPIIRSIPEDTPVGYSISIPEADDLDSPINGIISYQMLTVSDAFEFKADSLGDGQFRLYLVVKEQLDREIREQYDLEILASDGKHTGELTVTINVIDVNDNRPEFATETVDVSVPEDIGVGQTVTTVTASDLDDGSHGEVAYSFSDRNLKLCADLFSINQQSGDIIVEKELDYENTKTRQCDLVVEARDQVQSLPAEQTVVITVTDINDNPPAITVTPLTPSGKLELTESSPEGTYVAHIAVSDPDTSKGGTVFCELTPKSDQFRIEAQQGYKLRLSGSLDRDTVPSYALTFVCADQGEPPLSSNASIVITMLDENDNSPQFEKQTYAAVVLENNKLGFPLLTVTATDADAGQNSLITYSVHGVNSDFVSIDSQTGKITTASVYDYERTHNFSVEIKATDNGDEPRSGSAMLYVTIIDQNDEPPRFLTERVTFVIPENREAPYEVGQVKAEEVDDGEFVYSIVQEGIKYFSIDPLSGKIFTRMALDREENSGYEFIVKATDTAVPELSSTSSVSVYITDINDNEPVVEFPQPSNNTIHISDKTRESSIVAQVIAHDRDVGENGRLRFIITGGTGANLFVIDENSGTIHLADSILGLDDEKFILSITVQDRANPPRITDCFLNIIVNKSLPAPGTYVQHNVLESKNVTILISVAVVSTVVIVILVAAIVMVKRQESIRKRQRSYLPAMLSDHSNLVISPSRSNSDIPPMKPNQDRTESMNSSRSHQLMTFSNDVDTRDELPPKYDAVGSRSPIAAIQPDNRILYQQRFQASALGEASGNSTNSSRDLSRPWPQENDKAHNDEDSDSLPSDAAQSQDSGRGSHDGSMAESERQNNGLPPRHLSDHSRLNPIYASPSKKSKPPAPPYNPPPRHQASTSRDPRDQRRAPPPLPPDSHNIPPQRLSNSYGNLSLGRTLSHDSSDSVFYVSASHV